MVARWNREPMNAATTNGVLSTIMAVTWLGMMTAVQSQARPLERNPMAAEKTSRHGRPMVQYSSLSQASFRPLHAWMASSTASPAATLAMRTARRPMTTGLSVGVRVPSSMPGARAMTPLQ